MDHLKLMVTWCDPPADEANGPEIPTWGQLSVEINGNPITNHVPRQSFSDSVVDAAPFVTGPLSGLAEWFVEHFAHLLWEYPVPFPKADESGRSWVPGLHQAATFWNALRERDPDIDISILAQWQQRHTVGVAASQLALPSIVMIPEPDVIALFVQDNIPAVHDSNIQFRGVGRQSEFWLERSQLKAEILGFVHGVIRRASADSAGTAWAKWMTNQLDEVQKLEANDAFKRLLNFGSVAAQLWDDKLGKSPVRLEVEGLLCDVRALESAEDVDCLVEFASAQSKGYPNAEWRTFRKMADRIGGGLPSHQGYRMAREVRRKLNLGDRPIHRVDALLASLDIVDETVESRGLFRSGAVVRDNRAFVGVAREVDSFAFRRSASAAALGRVLFDSRNHWAAAVGTHSRWLQSQRATAFSAELLAPTSVVRERYLNDAEGLADDYGISVSSARWRIHNARENRP
jgi:hypothetical protein